MILPGLQVAYHRIAGDKIARTFEHNFGPAIECNFGHARLKCDPAAFV